MSREISPREKHSCARLAGALRVECAHESESATTTGPPPNGFAGSHGSGTRVRVWVHQQARAHGTADVCTISNIRCRWLRRRVVHSLQKASIPTSTCGTNPHQINSRGGSLFQVSSLLPRRHFYARGSVHPARTRFLHEGMKYASSRWREGGRPLGGQRNHIPQFTSYIFTIC